MPVTPDQIMMAYAMIAVSGAFYFAFKACR